MTVITFLMFALSVVMVGCGGLRLEAPTNVRYDGSTITWNKVEGADLYTVTIGEKEYTVSANRYAYNANGNEFTVTIKGSSKLSKVVSAEETIQTFIPLSKIETVNVDADGNLSWSAVDNATAYEIKIDNGQAFENIETTYADMPEGQHTVQVRPIVSGDPSYYSSWSTAKTMTKLAQVSKDDITYSNVDRSLSWKVITGAQYYQVKINGVVVEEQYTGTSYHHEADNTDFEVSIKAIGNGVSTFNGKESEVKGFVFLDTVSNVFVEDGTLKWTAVPGADAYKIKQNGAVRSEEYTKCELENIASNTQLRFQIMPISKDSAFFSDWSAEKNVFLLNAPVIEWNDDMSHEGQEMESITWNTVEGATGYIAKVTTPDGFSKEDKLPETQRFYKNAYLATGDYIIQIKATSTSTDKDDSKYSDKIVVTRLEAPRAADGNYIVSDARDVKKGFSVTFRSVSGAANYKLYKDGNLVQTHQATQFNVTNVVAPDVITPQSFTYKIQAVGAPAKKTNGTTYATISSLMEESLSFDIKVLQQPATPEMDGYTYKFGEISGCSGYFVNTGSGDPYLAGNTSYDLSNLPAGPFEVSVCAIGNGAQILSSNYTGPIRINRLEAPTNVRIDTSDASEGVLAWGPVEHAKSYQVVFNNDGNPVPAEEMMNINQYITTEGTTVYMQTVANYFNDEDEVYYMTSKPGLTTQFVKLDVPRFGDVKFNNNQFIWNMPDNVKGTGFTPTYIVYNGNGSTYNGTFNGESLDISGLAGGQDYTFEVKAIGNGTKYINSEKTAAVSIHKLSTPVVTKENGKYVWGRVTGAQSYVVYVDGVVAQTYDHLDGTTQKYEFAPNFKDIKNYQIKIIAKGDNGNESIDSNPCEFTQEVKQLSTPEFSVSYSEASYSTTGKIVVTITKESTYVDGTTATTGKYAYFISGVEQMTDERTCSHIPNTAGKHSVAVYACSGSFDDNGVYYLQSQTAGSKTNTAIDLLHVPNASSINLTGEGFLTWATISGATGYELEFAVNGGEYGDVVTVTNAVSYDFYEKYMEAGDEVTTLKVRIRAKGNGNNVISSTTVEKQFDSQNLTK